MLIRHGKTQTKHSQARRRSGDERAIHQLDRGAARLALRAKREGPVVDAYGTPMPLANGLAQGYSVRELERRATGRRKVYFT